MGRNYLKGRDGDRINAVLAAAGYNFTLLLRWLARLLRALFQALATTIAECSLGLKTLAQPFFTGDYRVRAVVEICPHGRKAVLRNRFARPPPCQTAPMRVLLRCFEGQI